MNWLIVKALEDTDPPTVTSAMPSPVVGTAVPGLTCVNVMDVEVPVTLPAMFS